MKNLFSVRILADDEEHTAEVLPLMIMMMMTAAHLYLLHVCLWLTETEVTWHTEFLV
jgi:hypothetical protein